MGTEISFLIFSIYNASKNIFQICNRRKILFTFNRRNSKQYSKYSMKLLLFTNVLTDSPYFCKYIFSPYALHIISWNPLVNRTIIGIHSLNHEATIVASPSANSKNETNVGGIS